MRAPPQPGLLTQTRSKAGWRFTDSGLDCGGDPASRGTDHTLAEGRGNGIRLTSIGKNGDDEVGARELKTGAVLTTTLLARSSLHFKGES